MQTPREDKIRMLVSAANNGMASVAQGTSAAEVYSAYATMFRNAVQLAVETHTDTTEIRRVLHDLLALCDTTPGKVH